MPTEFTLDPFQLEAIEAIDADRSVLVSAPTGSGKTLVAEHAVARALEVGKKAFYTTPIKALSNQKYHDLCRLFGSSSVGLLTGDTSINGDASAVVMTTEVLRNMIYVGSPALTRLAVVILDEVHYLQDAYRGPVWEEIIIHLPVEVRLVCLSATVSNADEFGAWIESLRGPTSVVLEHRRPVKLDNRYLVHDRHRDHLILVPINEGDRSARSFDINPHQRWARRRYSTPKRPDVVELLEQRSMLPAIYFIFSRAACDDAVKACLNAGICLTNDSERQEIRSIIERHVGSLEGADLNTLDFGRWQTCLEAGIASHHAGLVPQFKEAVEACFVAGLVKVVFATETLALGINMPAKTVVLEKLTKFTGEHHEFLTPGQYTQLTGRAGRRGIDNHGTAIVAWSPYVPFDRVASLVSSRRFNLQSAFRPTYNMAINLISRYDRNEAHEILGRSFAQFLVPKNRKGAKVRARQSIQQRTGSHSRSLTATFDRTFLLLEELDYVDEWKLTAKGHCLANLYHESDLLVAEALTSGVFDGLNSESLAALVSCLTFERREPGSTPDAWFPSRELRKRHDRIVVIGEELNRCESRYGLDITRAPDAGFVALAYAWSSGLDLAEVLDGEEISGGDFVRNVRQLIDLLRQIAVASISPATSAAASRSAALMQRGVVAAATIAQSEDEL